MNDSAIKTLTEEEISEYEASIASEAAKEIEQLEREGKDISERKEYQNYAGEDRVVSSYALRDYYSKNHVTLGRYRSGLENIDALCGGFEECELVTITGFTGHGKTLFAKTLTSGLSEFGCLWFTFEEPPRTFIERFKELPAFWIPNKHTTSKLTWIEKRIIESKVKYKAKIVFIDHLHYLVPLDSKLNTSFLVGAVMRELKQMAIRTETIIFVIAHTLKLKEDEKPDLANIRDSSFVAQESDKVFYVRRSGTKDNDGEVVYNDNGRCYLLKNRLTGKLGKVGLFRDELTGIFVEGEIIYDTSGGIISRRRG